MLLVYSNGCPKCNILTKQLRDKEIKYVIRKDFDKIVQAGLTSLPVVELEDGTLHDFDSTINYIQRGLIK